MRLYVYNSTIARLSKVVDRSLWEVALLLND